MVRHAVPIITLVNTNLCRLLTQSSNCAMINFCFPNFIYLHPTAGQLAIQWRLWWNLLLSVLTNEHGGGKAVPLRWACNWQVKRITLRWSSAFYPSMTSWFLKEEEDGEKGHRGHCKRRKISTLKHGGGNTSALSYSTVS